MRWLGLALMLASVFPESSRLLSMSSSDNKNARPLSPFMLGSVYRLQLTSVLSLMHRVTGVGLAVGLVILVWWLVALAGGPESYGRFLECAQSLIGQLVLAGISLAFFYHMSNGIRHLLWDAGLFLELSETYKTGRIVVAAAIVLTAIVWMKAYGVFL